MRYGWLACRIWAVLSYEQAARQAASRVVAGEDDLLCAFRAAAATVLEHWLSAGEPAYQPGLGTLLQAHCLARSSFGCRG